MLGNRPTIHVGEAHEFFRRVTQQIHLEGLSNVFILKGCPQIKEIFLFGNDFSYMACDAPKPGGPLTTRQPAEYS